MPAPIAIKVGDSVTFGHYEQDNNVANGKEPISWRVLAVEENKALVLSEKNLNSMPYNANHDSVAWETCSLREWLNEEFLNAAFTVAQQHAIVTVTRQNDDNHCLFQPKTTSPPVHGLTGLLQSAIPITGLWPSYNSNYRWS